MQFRAELWMKLNWTFCMKHDLPRIFASLSRQLFPTRCIMIMRWRGVWVWKQLYNIGWPWGGYKNILPEMLTILPESKTRVILLASRAIYSCIPRKRAIQYYYYYYSYRALCVILLSNDRGRLPAAILSSHESESLWDVATVTKVGGA